MDEALRVARTLRAEGFHVTSVKVDGVAIELAAVIDAKQPGAVTPPAFTQTTVADEWGGEKFKQALEATQPDLVDDDDQPAVRS